MPTIQVTGFYGILTWQHSLTSFFSVLLFRDMSHSRSLAFASLGVQTDTRLDPSPGAVSLVQTTPETFLFRSARSLDPGRVVPIGRLKPRWLVSVRKIEAVSVCWANQRPAARVWPVSTCQRLDPPPSLEAETLAQRGEQSWRSRRCIVHPSGLTYFCRVHNVPLPYQGTGSFLPQFSHTQTHQPPAGCTVFGRSCEANIVRFVNLVLLGR